jgi:hypothetical protein
MNLKISGVSVTTDELLEVVVSIDMGASSEADGDEFPLDGFFEHLIGAMRDGDI